ncbi:WD repeat-containing protein 88 [Elasticomyces elasticus]|nr:WD repeat-containing protein 88 [Elasticomyces elasticus]
MDQTSIEHRGLLEGQTPDDGSLTASNAASTGHDDSLIEEQLSIFDAATVCHQRLRECLEIPSLMERAWAENRLADFNLWAAGVGAFSQRKASLDERLAFQPDAVAVVVNLLVLLAELVERCKELGPKDKEHIVLRRAEDEDISDDQERGRRDLFPQQPSPGSFATWSDETSSRSPSKGGTNNVLSNSALAEVTKDVYSILGLLTRIGAAIRKSGTISRLQNADRSFDPKEHEELEAHLICLLLAQPSYIEKERYRYRDNVSDNRHFNLRFRGSSISQVQKRLIEANLMRRNRFEYAQRHAEKLSERHTAVVGPQSVDTSKAIGEKNRSLPTIKPAHTGPDHNLPLKEQTVPQDAADMTETEATGVGTAFVVDPSKEATPSQQALTEVSTTGSKINYPHPPKVEDDRQSFRCPCCCQILPKMFVEKFRWRFAP